MNYTRRLEYGDMVCTPGRGRHWVLIDSVDYGKDVHCMKFFDLQHGEIISYTSPWGLKLPGAFTVI